MSPARPGAVQPTPALYPPSSFTKLSNDPPIYSLDASSLSKAIDQIATQPLPDPQQVFPWLHGLHADNHVQLAFFTARKKSLRRTPRCLRSITIIKAGGDLTHSKIKGAVAPQEVLSINSDGEYGFHDCDPRDGFSVRNFQIQAAKFAKISDIVVYGDKSTSSGSIRALAEGVAKIQLKWKQEAEAAGESSLTFNTFVLSIPFHELEKRHPDLVAIHSNGVYSDSDLDFSQLERAEMCSMSKASPISDTVYQGPTPDFNTEPGTGPENDFDIFIEASDHASLPDKAYLDEKTEELGVSPIHLEFPSSGSIMPPSWSQSEVDALMRMCQWIYRVTHETLPSTPSDDRDGDIPMTEIPTKHRKVLIHCADGYTETSMLVVAYYMYAEGVPVHEAWVQLHVARLRNFFAYPSDVALLTSIQSRILAESPKLLRSSRRMAGGRRPATKIDDPPWLAKMDGSLPSRILPYMYLGNLTHANNPLLLKALGIKRILSIGEPVTWTQEEIRGWDSKDLLYIDRVQDNGIDPLTQEFGKCLDFIGQGKQDGFATLVHCRVGVSRSATICIAEVMSSLGLSFPRAYCFVRARRLNVIIQPHLRFVYELLKWDEHLQVQRCIQRSRKRGQSVAGIKESETMKKDIEEGGASEDGSESKGSNTTSATTVGIRREMDWPSICREIAGLNKPYSRQ
ncbi:putative pps1 dual specificty phosphatase [Phaeomoniella chlamydospora]|uniref:Putative pps1 dual specificty phosphatase n=1 Tax=Phaeomoniella chlamydospora TaxID=158046 RepID=A0A0G2E5J0_PHACM|nr:putative pps1 dual specificty phosphatase [Phaeomoniella chlamydospora]